MKSSLNSFSILPEYQQTGVQRLIEQEKIILADGTGLGKTVQTVHALDKIGERAIVICPRKIDGQWKKIIRMVNPNIVCNVPHTREERLSAYANEEIDMVIISYEMMVMDWKFIAQCDFGVYIFDEAHRLCNPDTKRHRIVAKMLPAVRYRFLLTATPIMNKGEDLFFLLKCLDPSYPAVVCYRLGLRNASPDLLTQYLLKGSEETVHNAISPYILRREASDESKDLILPDEEHNIIKKPMLGIQSLIYKRTDQPLLETNYVNVLAQITSLRQAADDPRLIDEHGIGWKLAEISEICDWGKTVVFTEFIRFADLIEEYLKLRDFSTLRIDGKTKWQDSDEMQQRLNTEIDVIICTRAAEEGIDLQAAHQIIHADLPYNPSRLDQRNGRIARIGQKAKLIRFYYLITKDSVEERMMDIIYSKEKIIDGVIEPVTERVTLEIAIRILSNRRPRPDRSIQPRSEEGEKYHA